MKTGTSIQVRTMLLFCAAAGVLLVGSSAGAYVLFDRAVRSQLDRQLTETAGPIIADQIADPEEKDVDQLNLADAYFEVLDSSGHVLQRSKNLKSDLTLDPHRPFPHEPDFQTVSAEDLGEIRVAIVPFDIGEAKWALAVACAPAASRSTHTM